MPLKLVPYNTAIDFLGKRWIAFILSIMMIIASFALLASRGLNFGIDFTGGILIEARFEQAPSLAQMREQLSSETLNLGDVSLQTIGSQKDIMIRIGQSKKESRKQIDIINQVKASLEATYGSTIDYRKVDYVGPKVGSELIASGLWSMVFALAAIMFYIWIRFEWHYGLGAVLALIHDVILTLGFLSITQLDVNLSSVAALLTIIGYSINDSVVIFDRIRENLRKYKTMDLPELLNRSINDNLARTLLTSLTTLVALLALVIMGGDVILSFSLAAFFGVIVGTYSSIFVAAPILIFTKLRADTTLGSSDNVATPAP